MHKAPEARSSRLMNETMRLFFKWDKQPSGRASFYLKYRFLGYYSVGFQQGLMAHSARSWSSARLRCMCGPTDVGTSSRTFLTVSLENRNLLQMHFLGDKLARTLKPQRPALETNKETPESQALCTSALYCSWRMWDAMYEPLPNHLHRSWPWNCPGCWHGSETRVGNWEPTLVQTGSQLIRAACEKWFMKFKARRDH